MSSHRLAHSFVVTLPSLVTPGVDARHDFSRSQRGLFPLWGRGTTALAHEMIELGIRATLTCIDPRKLDRSFAGRSFDHALLDDLPHDVDPCGENGEFHTFAWAGPMFSHPISVGVGETVERDGFVFADLLPAEGSLAETKASS